MRVTPFGNPRITGCVLLPEAFRSLPRPSSPDSSKASTVNPYSLDHISFSSPHTARGPAHPYNKCSYLPLFLMLPKRNATSSGQSRCVTSSLPYYMSKNNTADARSRSRSLGLTRLELVTPSLSEKCSNRLSYRPQQYKYIFLHRGGEKKKEGRNLRYDALL